MDPSSEEEEEGEGEGGGELCSRLRQQRIVAELGQQALETADLEGLLHDASVAVTEALDTDYCVVLEPVSDGDDALVRAGVGWRDGLVGTTVPAGPGSQMDYALNARAPVTVDDLRTEDRFSVSDVFTGHDVVSGICVAVGSLDDPWGVLETYTTDRREFTRDDATVVENVANTLAAAIDRAEKERQLRDRERRLERYKQYTDNVLAAVDDVFYVVDETGTFQRWNESLRTVTGYSDAEIESMGPLDFVDEPDRDAVGNAIAEVFETGGARVEATVLTSDGDRIPYEFVASRLENPDGTPILAGIGRDITERTERNRRLDKYERIVETINDGIYAVDEAGHYTMVNDAFTELTGYTREELHGSHATRIVDETTLDEAATLREEMNADDGANPTMETTVRTAEDDRVPVEVTFASLSTDGEQERVGVVRDISARVERERALEASERRYRTLVENFPNGAVGLFDEELCYTAVGGELLDRLDLSPAERIGRSISEIHSDALLEEIEPSFRAALAGEANSFEVDYHDRHLYAHTLPVRNADDDVYAWMLVVEDVTERREAQRELRKSEAKFRMIAENLDEIVWMTTENVEEFVYINPAFEEVWGLDREDLYDDPLVFLESVHPDDRDRVQEAFTGLPEREFDETYRIVRPDGEVRWIHAGGARVTDEDDEMARIVGIGEDITERTERERRLEQLVERLEESNERLEQFAYAASHDLQEPLRMVSSYLQLIERRYADALDDDGEEFLAFAVDGADRMRSMIEGLLEYSRVETRGNEFEPVELERVLEDVRENLQVTVEESDAEITAESLPRVEGDAGQLRQVLQNLLANAIEHSGSGPPRVHVAAERTGAEWTVSVTDEGVGIDPINQERIFEIFEGGHGETGYSGTGIGLALCERIVERHGGDIWVDSEPGEGATFSFTLPAVRERSGD
ncbi:PAS domain S-box protein [Halomontanus rarus]|uniref:PAS domain S-box protein n=1 Tax=Halomontanus rarus TaxID=3034020 RepID=UPI0023E7EE05|nr:PAS domain S-box protein [Halovivax sp. TS33]